jgi:cold shock protein
LGYPADDCISLNAIASGFAFNLFFESEYFAPQWSVCLATVRSARRLGHVLIELRVRSFVVSQGTIKKVLDKGFGFIEGERGDIFFHSSAVEGGAFDTLHVGQQVEYNEARGPKGPCAENVRVVS